MPILHYAQCGGPSCTVQSEPSDHLVPDGWSQYNGEVFHDLACQQEQMVEDAVKAEATRAEAEKAKEEVVLPPPFIPRIARGGQARNVNTTGSPTGRMIFPN